MNAAEIARPRGRWKLTLEERFWAKVDRRGPDECWPWNGATDGNMRGQISKGKKNFRAPRVAWELTKGEPFPKDRDACHSCDHPWCVNPSHIWPGTASQNAVDCVRKTRQPKVVLTAEDVIEIRSLFPEMTGRELAKRYGVHPGTISKIRKGQIWSWL